MTAWVAVSVVAAIVGLMIGWLLGRIAGRRSSLVASDLLLATAVPPHLYTVDVLEIEVEFDENGDGLFVRRETGLRPAVALAEIVVPYRFAVTPQGALEVPRAISMGSAPAEWRRAEVTGTIVRGTLVIVGPFPANQTIPGYELHQPFKKAFFTSKEETLQAYQNDDMKREYVGVATYVPVRTLRCTVRFPPSHQHLSDGPSGIAFIGETEYTNVSETKRISTLGIKQEGNSAQLEISTPRPGIRYGITWLGPSSGSPS